MYVARPYSASAKATIEANEMRESSNPLTLADAIRTVANEDRALFASPAVEARLRQEVRSVRRARRRRAYGTLALGALLVAAGSLPAWRLSHQKPQTLVNHATTLAAREVTTAFLPLPYSGVPLTNGELVRLDVPRSALVSFGLAPMEASDASDAGTVQADVLVGEDGLARAIRFVRPVAADLNP